MIGRLKTIMINEYTISDMEDFGGGRGLLTYNEIIDYMLEAFRDNR